MKIRIYVIVFFSMIAVLSAFNLAHHTTFLISPELKGSWKVVRFYDHKKDTLLSSLRIHMIIEEGGISNGFMGCNKFRTDCSIKQDSIFFGTITSTRKFCTKEYMDIEDQFRYALKNANRYELHKNELYLLHNKKKLVQFIKQ